MGNVGIYHGRLGKDANVRDTSAGEICELRMACDFWEDGQKQDFWFKVKVWRPSQAVKNLRTRDQVLVTAGDWTEEKWTGKDGDERVTLVITAIKIEVLPGRNGEAEPAPASKPATKPATTTKRPPASDDW